jgi:hypothetical protein
MTTRDDLERAVSSGKNHSERILYVAALLSREMEGTKDPAIVVGGSAIEVYTSGRYVSEDLDIVTDRIRAIPIVESWGFVPEGRIWWRSDWKIAVDLVGSNYTGSRIRTQLIQTKYGPVRLAGVEDLVIKRLAEAKHWRSEEALRQAIMLSSEYSGRMDEAYLDDRARREDVVDILADLRSRIGRLPSSAEKADR